AREAWDLRTKGYRLKDIAGMQGCGEQAVAARLKWWREEGSKAESETGQSIIEYHRALDLDRIEYYLSVLRIPVAEGDAEAIKLSGKLLEQKAKLIGSNAPVKVAVEAKQTHYKIEGVDLGALK